MSPQYRPLRRRCSVSQYSSSSLRWSLVSIKTTRVEFGPEDRLYRGSGYSERACRRITLGHLVAHQERDHHDQDQRPETCSSDCLMQGMDLSIKEGTRTCNAVALTTYEMERCDLLLHLSPSGQLRSCVDVSD